MASYRLSKRALTDLDSLYDHGVRNFGLRQADEYYDALVGRFQDLADSPKRWPTVKKIGPGLRRSVFGSHSVYYRIEPTEIHILRILGQQNLGGAFD